MFYYVTRFVFVTLCLLLVEYTLYYLASNVV